jgi:predicted DNA-binding transcriptional regulator AlpA
MTFLHGETPQEECVRLYTTTDLDPNEILEVTGVSRPTLYRYLSAAGVTLNRRSKTLTPGINAPKVMSLKRRVEPSGSEPAPIVTARRKCLEANCLPLEQPYVRALKFQPDHIQTALNELHKMNLTLIHSCLGEPAEWGTWLAGRKFFSDPATYPAYPLTLEECVAIIENPEAFLTANAPKIREHIAKVKQDRTAKLNQLVG